MIDDVINFLPFLLILGTFRQALLGIGDCIEKAQNKIITASTFTCETFISFKIVLHISCVVKGIPLKDLEPMLCRTDERMPSWKFLHCLIRMK